jgi:SAM-dependent methyltransferase
VSDAEREKWNRRYASGDSEPSVAPTALLAAWVSRMPRGRALDVACGAGRNALFLADAGYEVDAVDISAAGLELGRRSGRERGLDVRWICADLDLDPARSLPETAYDLVVWVRYVNHGLVAQVVSRLGPGGHLVCEQHLRSAADVVGPQNPAFRLRPGELLEWAKGLEVLHYFEGEVRDPDGRASALAQVIARKAG